MASPITVRKTNRTIVRKEIFTPSRNETSMKYKLNERTALLKKIDAAKRDFDVEIELKRGTLVMSFTPAAYEVYKRAIIKYYDEHQNKTYIKTVKSSKTSNKTIGKAIVEESFSIRPKENMNIKCRQWYRINMFNTTSRMDINGRQYQQFICEDLPEIIKTIDMANVKQINEKIIEICELVLSNQAVTEYSSKNHNTEDNDLKCENPNKLQIIGRRKNITTPEIETNKTQSEQENIDPQINHIKCPACFYDVNNEDSVECTKCCMWLHKECSNLTEEEFEKQSEDTNLTYTCPLCENLEDIFINESFIQFELENDREGTNTPLNITFNIEEEEEEENAHIAINNSNQQQENESKTEVHVSYNQRDNQEQLVNDINEEETKVKTVVPDELNENLPTHVSDHLSHSPINLKPRPKKGKKKETIELEQQLTASRARIIMLEEQNRDYENTISLIHCKWKQQTTGKEKDEIHQWQNSALQDIKTKVQMLEESISAKFTTMNIEFQHKLDIHEIKLKHELEIRDLKTEINMMKLHDNRPNYEQHESKCACKNNNEKLVNNSQPSLQNHKSLITEHKTEPLINQQRYVQNIENTQNKNQHYMMNQPQMPAAGQNQLGPILTKVFPFQHSHVPMQGQYQLRPILTQRFPGPYQQPQEIRNIQGQNLMHQVNSYRMNNQHSSIQQANMPMVNHFGNVRQNDHQKYHQQNKRDFHQIPTFLNQSKVKAPESMTLPNLEKFKTQQPRVIPTGKYPRELLKNNTHKLKSNCDRPKQKHSDSSESEQNTNIQSVKVTENNANSGNQEQRDSTSFLEHGRASTSNHPQKRKSL
ncbi:putative uncharacterized protein DDB_G0282133 [Mytilus trossulus]|uniref:putative uncharacterized protein DDB_G0282133 n=1 Tax=Mytilus trossulus TaxID=6551 RepID=UPI0030047AA8